MNQRKAPDIQGVLRKYGDALSVESVASSGYPEDVKQALLWAAGCDDDMTRLRAIVLRAGVPGGFLDSVTADDTETAAAMADTLGAGPAGLLAAEEEARLVRTGGRKLPALVYRSRLRDDASGLLLATQAAFTGDPEFMKPGNFGPAEAVPGIDPTAWRCYFTCALCAVLAADPVPLDEIAACAACLASCMAS